MPEKQNQAYANERLYGNDTLNMVPLTAARPGQVLNYKDHSWFSKDSPVNVTIRVTTTDTEALVMPPRPNINASGVKKGTPYGLGDSQDPYR